MPSKLDFDPYNSGTNSGGLDFDPYAETTQAAPATPAIARPSGLVRRVVGDTAVDLGKGIIGVGEAAVGAANLITGGHAGKALESIGYDPATSKKMLEEGYTPERVAANKEVADAKGFLGTAKAMIANPSTIAGAAVESAPLMVGGGAVARGLGKVIASPVLRGAIGEGVVGAGAAAEQIRQQSDDRLLDSKGALSAVGSGVGTAALGAVGGKVAQKLGIADVDVALAGGNTLGAAKKNILRRVAEGALSEGVFEELPQSAQEQMWQNYATGKPLMDGVAEASAMGALAGGVMGGGFSAIARPDRQAPTTDTKAAPEPEPAQSGPLGLPAPDGTKSYGVIEVGPDGVARKTMPDGVIAVPDAPIAQTGNPGLDRVDPSSIAAGMRQQAAVQRATAKTVLGKTAAMATEMQADAIDGGADPFDMTDFGATTSTELPPDGFERLGMVAQGLGLDPDAIVAAARADMGDDTTLDTLDDRILATYAQSLGAANGPAQEVAGPVPEQPGLAAVQGAGDAAALPSAGQDQAGVGAVEATGQPAEATGREIARADDAGGAQAEGVKPRSREEREAARKARIEMLPYAALDGQEFTVADSMLGGDTDVRLTVWGDGSVTAFDENGQGFDITGGIKSGMTPERALAGAMGSHQEGQQPDAGKVRRKGTDGAQAEAVDRKPLYEMTRQEIEAQGERARNAGVEIENRILGDRADQYRKAVRMANSSHPGRANRGAAEQEAIEATLTPAQLDEIAGVNAHPDTFDEADDYRDALQSADVENAAEASERLGYFLSQMGRTQGQDPSGWGRREQVAYSAIRMLRDRITEKGWDSKAIQQAAIQRAAGRFADPNDAVFMLDRFMPADAPTAQPPRGEALPNPDIIEGEATRVGPQESKPELVAVKDRYGDAVRVRESIDSDPVLASQKERAVRAATLDETAFVAAEVADASAKLTAAREAAASAASRRADFSARLNSHQAATKKWRLKGGGLRKGAPAALLEAEAAMQQEAVALRRAEEMAALDISEASKINGPAARALYGRLRERLNPATKPRSKMTSKELKAAEKEKKQARRKSQKVGPARKPRDMLDVIARSGGLNREAFRAQGVDPAEFNRQSGIRYVFRKKGGMSMDGLLEMMQQEGYLPRDPEGAPPTVGFDEVMDLLDRALRGGRAIYADDQWQDVEAYEEAKRQADEEYRAELDGSPAFDGALTDQKFEELQAAEIADLTEQAYDLGASNSDVIGAAFDSANSEQHRQNLARIVAQLENKRDIDQRAESGRGEGRVETRQEAQPGTRREGTGQAQEVRPTGAGLFGAPTAREVVDAAARDRDAKRDGKTGTGRTDMLAGDGELFAGPRPEQARVDSRPTREDRAREAYSQLDRYKAELAAEMAKPARKRDAQTILNLQSRVDLWQDEADGYARPAPQAEIPGPQQQAAPEAFEHNGTRIYPGKIRSGDEVLTRWAVESADNKARRLAGERTLGGDSLHATREAAIAAADAEAKRAEADAKNKAEIEALEQKERDERAARQARTAGKSLSEIKADDFLDTQVRVNGKVTTRRAWVESLIANGEKPSVEMVDKIKPMSRMKYNRATNEEQAAHERKVKAGGKVAEYSIGDFIVTKTEYDYAQSLNQKPQQPAGQPNGEGKAAAKIDDFGERLEGARKFLPPSLKEELGDDQIATLPLSKVWPSDAHLEIEDPMTAAMAFAARKEIPAKPRKPHLVKRWVEQVKMFRGIMQQFTGESMPRMLEIAEKQGSGKLVSEFFPRVQLLAQLPRETWGRVEKVGQYPNARRMKTAAELREVGIETVAEKGKLVEYFRVNKQTGARERISWVTGIEDESMWAANPHSTVTIDGKTTTFDVPAIGPDEVGKVLELLGQAAPKKDGLTSKDFEIRVPRGSKTAFINRKGDSAYRRLKEFVGDDAVAQARAYLKDNVPALSDAWEAVKARDNVGKGDMRRTENRERQGENRRNGKDVTEAMFAEAFGFRGVQFGNWVKQGKEGKERQGLLNESYDALLDLADLLGIPSRAISLEGTLGLSLGARGKGKAAAHFESQNLVINLTKTQGAGALAHEWFHALDNYFARKRGGEVKFTGDQQGYRENNYITYKPEPMLRSKIGFGTMTRAEVERRHRQFPSSKAYLIENWEPSPNHKAGVRPVVEKAFAALVSALNESPMADRSRAIDGVKMSIEKADGYWSRIIERGARSFENYVISKMAQRGWSNDFLANINDWAQWEAAGKNPDRYPHLKPEEEAPITEAFDKLFQTIEARQDGDKVALESVEELTDADLTPAERAAFDRQSIDKKALSAKLSRQKGERDADGLGIRKAVQAAVGNMEVQYLHGLAGLDGMVKEGYRQRLEDQQAARKNKTRTAGLFVPANQSASGKAFVVLFTDVVSDPNRAAFTASHEIAGHMGLRALLGNKLNSALDRAVTNKTVRAVSDSMTRQRNLRPDQRYLAIEEALADLAAAQRTGNYDRIKEKHGVEVPTTMRSGLRATIARFIEAVRNLFRTKDARFSDAQVYSLLENAWKAAQASEATTDGPALESVSNETRAAYEARIDALFAGDKAALKGARILDRSDVLGMMGLGEGPMNIAEGKVIEGRYNHRLTAEHWKKVPEWLENPALVFQSEQGDGSRLVFIAPETVGGEIVRMIVQPNAKQGMDVHLLVNAYDAPGGNPMMRWAQDGLLRYVDTKKSPALAARSGRRLPGLADKPRGSTQTILSQKDLGKYRAESALESVDNAWKAAKAEESAIGTPEALESVESGSVDGMDRATAVAEAKRLGLPATGKTDAIANLVRIASTAPAEWSRSDFDAILPHLSVHQDARGTGGGNVESIMRDGLNRGMVDSAAALEPGAKGWSWAKGYTGNDAYVFISGSLKYRAKGDPRLAPGNKPLFHAKPEKGGSLFDAIKPASTFNESAYRPAVVSWAKSKFGDRVAPNGKPAWQNFVEWFGDSQVVNDKGEPLVVFHGTRGDFDTFKEQAGSDLGFHFGSSAQAFERLVSVRGMNHTVGRDSPTFLGVRSTVKATETDENIVPAYLSIRNPLRITDPGYFGASDEFFIEQLRANGVSASSAFGNSGVVRALENAGYDGLVYENGSEGDGDSYVALHADQIKSATANAGNFSPNEGSILESVEDLTESLGNAMNSVRGVKLPAGYLLADLLNRSQSGALHWWHKSVGTMYNLAQRNPFFKDVFDRVQNMVADVSHYANSAMDLAPEVLPKFDSVRDSVPKAVLKALGMKGGKDPMSPQDSKKVSAAVFEGTLKWTRDANGDVIPAGGVDKAGIVWTDAELASRYGMDARQIGLYRQVRAAIDRSLDDTATTQMLRVMGEDGLRVREEVLAAPTARQAANIIQRHIADMLANRFGLTADGRESSLQETATRVKEVADQVDKLKNAGYAPLSRFGRYTVYKDGDNPIFLMFETQREANRAARKLREQFGDQVRQGTMSDEQFKLFKGVTPETLELFGEIMGLDSTGNEQDDIIFQTFIKAAKSNRSAFKRLIHRKEGGVAGYSEDVPRVLASFLYSNARLAATNLHASGIQEAIQAVPKEQGDVKDAAIRLNEYIVNPDEAGAWLSSFNFAQYLGGSIASALVNMTQPLTMTFPWLSQYGGAWQAAKFLKEASALAVKGVDERTDHMLHDALKRADADGHTQPQEVHQLQAYAAGRGVLRSGDGTKAGDAAAKAYNAKARIMLAWGLPFSLAEQFNRRSTFIAAWKIAREQGMADPYGFAVQAVQATQGIYNKANKPQWSRNAIGGMAFTFKQYSINYVEMLHRMWTKGGKEGKQGVLLAAAVLFLLSGAGGLPGADDLDDVIDALMQRLGYNFSSKQEREEFFAGILGEQGAKFMEHGLSAVPGMPIDVSGRLGMGNLIPSTGLLVRKDDYSRDIAEIAGPTGDLAKRGLTAIDKLTQGDLSGSMLEIAPRAVANAWKGVEMATTGEYRDTRGRKVLDTTPGEAAAKAIGFQPASVAKVQQTSGKTIELLSNYKLQSAAIADRWAKGLYNQDPDEVRAAQQDLADWNRKNPDMPIRISRGAIQRRVFNLRMDRRQRLAKTTPKAVRSQVEAMLDDTSTRRMRRLAERTQEEGED